MDNDISARGQIAAALSLLMQRRAETTDAAEKAVINNAIDTLNGQLQDLDQAELLQAAKTVAAAADELEKVVDAAKTGAFDSYVTDVQGIITSLQNAQSKMHATEALPRAADPAPQPLASTAASAATPPTLPQPPSKSTSYAKLEAEYREYYKGCVVLASKKDNAAFYTSRLVKFKTRYAEVGDELGIPWYFIGIIHAMECGFDFSTHLHNGDPLSARTVHVPTGRPATGAPPFTWRESARDALVLLGYDKETDWSVPRMLYLWEKYNGFGYRKLGVPTPYLWSFSNLYVKGKFVADHGYDPEKVSAQCGAAVILKSLQDAGAV